MDSDIPILSAFTGIAGFERAFRMAGFTGAVDQYEIWEPARAVLQDRFPGAQLHDDVRELPQDLHGAGLVVAGFPCTDLSQAGRRAGIDGSASGLVLELLRRIGEARPEWILLENVPNMLWLHGGNAISVITDALDRAGYSWAYRILDAQYFGLNQRRRRVFLLASRNADPVRVLFRDLVSEEIPAPQERDVAAANGFYWTEGNRGVGWGAGVVPTVKGSTGASVPSPPGVWIPGAAIGHRLVSPSIEALEMLQGFRAGWTRAAAPRDRWKLVGNAVAVPVVRWIADGLRQYDELPEPRVDRYFSEYRGWDWAAYRTDHGSASGRVPHAPLDRRIRKPQTLETLLHERGSVPLSSGAVRGFAGRLSRSRLNYRPEFMRDLLEHAAL